MGAGVHGGFGNTHGFTTIKKYGGKSGDWSKQAVKIESQKYIFDIHFYKKGKNQYMAKVKSRKEKD